MKILTLLPFLILHLGLFGQDATVILERKFSLKFYSVGLGSNLNEAQPVFIVTDQHFIYTKENTRTDGNKLIKEQKDTICWGEFRATSIDSII